MRRNDKDPLHPYRCKLIRETSSSEPNDVCIITVRPAGKLTYSITVSMGSQGEPISETNTLFDENPLKLKPAVEFAKQLVAKQQAEGFRPFTYMPDKHHEYFIQRDNTLLNEGVGASTSSKTNLTFVF
jgi:hypothetical protein